MKTKITREELKRIHSIACNGWKKRIVQYGEKDIFSNTVDFTKEQIEEMVQACTTEQLLIVKEIFEIKDTWEDIKTVEDACKVLGETDNEVRQLRLLQNIPNLDRKTLAGQELIVVIKALNNGWIADWNNHSQYKYYPWFYLGKDFHLDGVDAYYSSSNVSARLCFLRKKDCEEAVEKFFNEYKESRTL